MKNPVGYPPVKILVLVPSNVTNVSMKIDGETPVNPFEFAEGQREVQCTALNFNPASTETEMKLYLAGKVQKELWTTKAERDVDLSTAVRASRFRKTWCYSIRLDKSHFQKSLKCLETVSQVFAETVLMYPISVQRLWMTINGEMPKTGNTTLEEGEYTVQCIAAGFFPKQTNLSIHLCKEDEPQNVTTRVRQLDDASAGTYRAVWTYTVSVNKNDTGDFLECREIASFYGASGTVLSIIVPDETPKRPKRKEPVGLGLWVAIGLLSLLVLLALCICCARYFLCLPCFKRSSEETSQEATRPEESQGEESSVSAQESSSAAGGSSAVHEILGEVTESRAVHEMTSEAGESSADRYVSLVSELAHVVETPPLD